MPLPIGVPHNYGPLQSGFGIELPDGYTVIVGKNDVGKSSLLQFIFKTLFEKQEIGNDRFCLLNPERIFIEATLETGGQTLEQYNRQIYDQLKDAPLTYHNAKYPSQSSFKHLIQNYSQRTQLNSSDELLNKLGFSNLVIKQGNQVIIDEVNIGMHGSGLRTVLPIIAVLTDPDIRYVLIDEPEQSLEPSIQKLVREMLYEASQSKNIIISTHSHLFLNRKNINSNFIFSKNSSEIPIQPVQSDLELYDLVYKLLGSSPEDLFLPKNFLIVEGSSDQVVLEKIISLMGYRNWDIKVIAAKSISATENYRQSFEACLTPYVLSESHYKDKVVVIVDKPNSNIQDFVDEIRRHISDRLFELPDFSLEEYLPEEFYIRAGRSKDDDVNEIEQIKDDYSKLKVLKTEISTQISQIINENDLKNLTILTDAINKAVTIQTT